MARKPPVERPRPSALVRAEHHGAPVHLDDKQRRLLDEALRRGQDLSEEIETKVAAYFNRSLILKVLITGFLCLL